MVAAINAWKNPWAKDHLTEKFGLYCAHLNNIISITTNSKEKAALESLTNL